MARSASRLKHLTAALCIACVASIRRLDRDFEPKGRATSYSFNATLAHFDGRFRLLQDLGYMSWHTNCPVSNRARSFEGDVDIAEVECGLGVDKKWRLPRALPMKLEDLDRLRESLPRMLPFGRGEEAVGYPYQLPHLMPSVAAPYAASQRIKFSRIDFIIPGSLLATLATGDFGGKAYTVQRWRGAVLIRGHNDMSHFVDLKSPGFQVERLVTGRRMDDLDLHETTVQHLQVLRLGRYNVLVVSKADAADDHGRLTEVTSVFAPNWKKIMFQMLAKGSTTLVRGIVEEKESDLYLNELGEYELHDIIEWSTTQSERKNLAASLLHALRSIQDRVLDPAVGKGLFHMNETTFDHATDSMWTHTPSLHILKDRSRSLLPRGHVLHVLFPF